MRFRKWTDEEMNNWAAKRLDEDEEDSLQDQLIREAAERAGAEFNPSWSSGNIIVGQMPWITSAPPDDYSSWTEYLLQERDKIDQGMKTRFKKNVGQGGPTR